jgi:hypothetical protein
LNALVAPSAVPPSTPACIAAVERVHEIVKAAPQVEIETHHVLHAGVYSRTICVPAGCVLVGALIKIPTTLVVCGQASVMLGDGEEVMVSGYQVLAASAGRKQAYITHADTFITMSFRTDAKSVEEAEREFTDEWEALMSRSGNNTVVNTGV